MCNNSSKFKFVGPLVISVLCGILFCTIIYLDKVSIVESKLPITVVIRSDTTLINYQLMYKVGNICYRSGMVNNVFLNWPVKCTDGT